MNVAYLSFSSSTICLLIISELFNFLLRLLTFMLTCARCVCVCVCVFISLFQGKEVCLWFLISSAHQTPADPPPFIPCPTCKALDLWLAVFISACVFRSVLVLWILGTKSVYVGVFVSPHVGMHLHECMPCWSFCYFSSVFWCQPLDRG